MKKVSNNVLAPIGFYASALHCGLKKQGLDLSVLYSKTKASVAGVFTKNIVKAAPVLYDQQLLQLHNKMNGVFINSGNANAATGLKGEEDASKMASLIEEQLSLDSKSMFVSSTGVIGVNLDMNKIEHGIKNFVFKEKETASKEIAEAILTTDTCVKEIAFEVKVNNKVFRIGGIAKGSGMIHPNMGTMLSYITTDVEIEQSVLQQLLNEVTNDTYNMISVDGDTSTNDTTLVFANGESGLSCKDENVLTAFKKAFYEVNLHLAKSIAKDGEGATKLIICNVLNASSKETAITLSKSVITSSLVKTAMFGNDANFGRIICALGYSGATFDQHKMSLYFKTNQDSLLLYEKGILHKFDEDKAYRLLDSKEVIIEVVLEDGVYSATSYGCDLSYDYVKINGSYRT